jgi:hypothetical protein
MAGKAVVKTRMAQLDQVGEAEVFSRYLELGSVPKMCAELFEPHGGKGKRVGVDAFYAWLHESPERWARWQRNKEVRGEIEMDLALDDAESATKENVQEKRLLVETRKWRTGLLNRDYRPGQSQVQVNVGIQVGAAWLEALQKLETIKGEVIE